MGLWEPFAAMPRHIQELFWQRKLPDARLEFDRSVPANPQYRPLRKDLEACFHAASMQLNGVSIPVQDFLAVITGCLLVVRLTQPKALESAAPETQRFFRIARPALEACYEQNSLAAISSLFRAVSGPLAAHSRMDTRLLTSRFCCDEKVGGKVVPKVVVKAVSPEVRKVKLDGALRPMFRVASTTSSISWISWKAAHLGRAEGEYPEYPVYIQSHALRQLHARANLPAAAPYIEAWLAESLTNPNIVERRGQELLVEYRIAQHRIGYLVVTPLEDLIAVRTFLFLTMEGTPEARRLKHRLGLARRDTEWVGLHELAAFTQTDLKDDPVLRALMEECGCGHLFSLEAGDCALEPKPLATELRRFLRLAA